MLTESEALAQSDEWRYQEWSNSEDGPVEIYLFRGYEIVWCPLLETILEMNPVPFIRKR